MKYPTKTSIKKTKKWLSYTWPTIELWINQYMLEKNIANTSVKGDPFNRNAWDSKTGCFRLVRLIKTIQSRDLRNPLIEIKVSIFPNGKKKDGTFRTDNKIKFSYPKCPKCKGFKNVLFTLGTFGKEAKCFKCGTSFKVADKK